MPPIIHGEMAVFRLRKLGHREQYQRGVSCCIPKRNWPHATCWTTLRVA
jgi:hypothetical protein